MTESELNHWLLQLKSEVEETNHCYPKNLVAGKPIPFFGNIQCARVLTIGVNPSPREFDPERGWDAVANETQWQDRMRNYFHLPGVPPWAWFETWLMCLEFLGQSYYSGSAAHIDVSPRPTRRMLAKKTDKGEFRSMVEHDVKWFFEILNNFPQIRLLLVAGPVPKADGKLEQLIDFIREQSPEHGAEFIFGNELSLLKTSSRPSGIPVFICPYDPKVDGRYGMVRDVYRSREILQKIVCKTEGLM